MPKVYENDIDNLILYEVDQYCKKYNSNKEELLDIIKSAYLKSADFHFDSDLWQEKINEAYEKGQADGSECDHFDCEYVDAAVENALNNEKVIYVDEHEIRMREEHKKGFREGYKRGILWEPPPKEYPDLLEFF